jgi:uncharacterized protein
MFDPKTILNLQAYVYMLINPDDKKPFYIGKGNNNRVFDHINCALTDLDAISAKYNIIRKIQDNGKSVEHVIVRHGLTDTEAFHIEASLIDILSFLGSPLSNKQVGHESIEKGLMTTDEIKRIYNAKRLSKMRKDCIIININQTFPKKKLINGDSIYDAIYNATKGIWAMDKHKIMNQKGKMLKKYVLSEYKGLIVEVFEVYKWLDQKRGYGIKAKKHGKMRNGTCFIGKIAGEKIRNRYINKSIAHLKKQGATFPVIYSLS